MGLHGVSYHCLRKLFLRSHSVQSMLVYIHQYKNTHLHELYPSTSRKIDLRAVPESHVGVPGLIPCSNSSFYLPVSVDSGNDSSNN